MKDSVIKTRPLYSQNLVTTSLIDNLRDKHDNKKETHIENKIKLIREIAALSSDKLKIQKLWVDIEEMNSLYKKTI